MLATIRQPRSCSPFGRDVQALFGDLFDGRNGTLADLERTVAKSPAFNIWQDETGLFVEAEVPGLTQENLDISVVGRELTIKGDYPEVKTEATEGKTLHRREWARGSFTRAFKLPFEVEASKVEAELKNGVLTISLPQSEEAKPKRINIRAS